MGPSRRLSNGRSPLVNQQSQITSFFSKTTSSSPSPSSTLSKLCPKLSPELCLNRSPSPSPTPSPLQPKPTKPLLVIGQTPSPPSTTPAAQVYGSEVIGRRIRVYWPLDKAWYDGYLESFDKGSGNHLVQYDDGEEESLDLANEKIEWVEESTGRFKRLRLRGSSAFRKVVIDEAAGKGDSAGGDSTDDDWGNKAEREASEDTDEEHVDLEEGKEGDDDEPEILAMKQGGKNESRKRKGTGVRLEVGTMDKYSRVASNSEFIVSEVRPIRTAEIFTAGEKPSTVTSSALVGDSTERFGKREDEKLAFLGPGRRDANRRRPGDINYDPRTLYLPNEFLKSLSGGQRQWWDFKAKHMDKVLFFKMGKFYELFEMDAHVGTKELDLQYMRGDQPHCGFPEKNFSMNVEKLARKGYRVLVVEQTETPEQLELRRKEKGAKDKVVRREICAVVTKGTLTEGELLSANPDPSYIMAVAESRQDSVSEDEHRIFGICAVDAATSRIILGQFQDDSECNALCSLLAELRPVEIIKPAKMLSPQTEKAILRHTRNPLVNELVPAVEFWDPEKTLNEVQNIYKNINYSTGSSAVVGESKGSDFLPDVLSRILVAGDDGRQALSALGGTLYYLKQAFLDETLLRFGKFEELPCSGFHNIAKTSYMVLDAAALENLEIFENSRNGGSTGTLYAQLNHCVTAFGKRLLKAWLARPLYLTGLIKERQDAVGCLRAENLSYALDFRKALSRLPDMERLLTRIFAGSEASGRHSDKVVLYEDASKKQLQEFISALRGCESMSQACSSLGVILDNVQSTKLRHLLSIGQGLPDVNPFLKHFMDGFDWDDANRSGRIIPHEGVDIEYDSACKKVKEIESSLMKHLKEQRKLLGDNSIAYVTVGKEAYLLEVPECLRGSISQDFELRSSKKGFFRYWTPHIKKLLGELSQAESEKEAALKSILRRMIGRFCEHHEKWRQLVSTVAELDVLSSLVIASDYHEGPTCRPAIVGSSMKGVPCFSAKGLGHPILRSDSLGKGAFVPNDITIGGSGNAGFILLTGPNMGGKSTLLRQVCLAVILAQVGADVPAESFELSPVDRIFVRMGAKDHIMAGQSTFLTELSETASMLSLATRDSLVALDELGRGTSTSDGQAIAEAVLDHFVNKIQCRGMFSTHYHRLAIDYQDDSKVALCHMACQVGSGAEGIEDVTFLYRLTSGACPKSYGINVARLAGLSDSLLKTAALKSKEFEGVYGRNRKQSGKKLTRQKDAAGVTLVQKVLSIASNMSYSNSSLSVDASPWTELQYRVRILLQQH